MIIAYRTADRAFFIFGFAKNARENIDDDELRTLREIAAEFLAAGGAELDAAVSTGRLEEITHDDEAP